MKKPIFHNGEILSQLVYEAQTGEGSNEDTNAAH